MRVFFLNNFFYKQKFCDDSQCCYFLHLNGVETHKKGFDSIFLFEEFCRIRGPPSFNLKKFKLKGDRNEVFT